MARIILRKRKLTAQYYTEDLDGVGLDIVRIPAGNFVMGSPEKEKDSHNDERPQHVVRVPEFYLGKYPITQAQWRVVAGWQQVKQELKPKPSHFEGDDNLPVEQVSWLDAKEFCARLSKRTEKKYRLPSEAEWEYACRAVRDWQSSGIGEQASPEEEQTLIQQWNKSYLKPFAYGETLTDKIANYCAIEVYGRGVEGEYRKKTTPVGMFPANRFGLYDMHGNVWEWCEDDWHANYEKAPTDGSVSIENNSTTKIMRGGAWLNSPRYCRSAYRNRLDVGTRYDYLGFRVACSPPGFP